MKSIISAVAVAVFAVFGPVLAAEASVCAKPVTMPVMEFDSGSAGGGDSHGKNNISDGEDDDIDPVQEEDDNLFNDEHSRLELDAAGH